MRLERRPWSADIEARLNRALGDDAEIIRNQCETRKADVWEVSGRGLFVLRMEGAELVVVAAQGRGLVEALAKIIAHLRPDSVRVHSSRVGMGRLLKKLGFQYAETVYRWKNG